MSGKPSRKAVIIIVEGASEETTLESVLKKIFDTTEVRFVVVHGDITTEKGTTPQTIKRHVNDCIKEKVLDIYHFQKTDILKIIHIVDADGAYIPDNSIVQVTKDIEYTTSEIRTNNREKYLKRNEQKRVNLNTLSTTPFISKTIPYRIFYMSCNLEHVLWNELKDFTDEEKKHLANEFDKKYGDDPDAFKRFMNDSSFAVPGDYKATWDFIKVGVNSLNRHSNLWIALGI